MDSPKAFEDPLKWERCYAHKLSAKFHYIVTCSRAIDSLAIVFYTDCVDTTASALSQTSWFSENEIIVIWSCPKAHHSRSLSIPSAFVLLPEFSQFIPEIGCGQRPQKI